MTTTSRLRQLLRQALPTDSDLEAFCVDYFPEVYRRYSPGMDPQTKLSLLLLCAKPDRIHAALAEMVGSEAAAKKPPCGPLSDDRFNSPTDSSPSLVLGSRWASVPYRTLSGIGLSILVLVFVGSTLRAHLEPTETAPSVVLRSTPPGAQVWDMRTGRSLGTTPLFIDPGVLPATACLRSPGFHDQLISFPQGQLPRTAVVLRPVGSSQSEVCDVPIPIIP